MYVSTQILQTNRVFIGNQWKSIRTGVILSLGEISTIGLAVPLKISGSFLVDMPVIRNTSYYNNRV